MNIPELQQAVMPYLVIKNARGFLDYAKNVFGATETSMNMHDDGETIRHAQIMINGCTIMFSEAGDQFKATDSHLFVYVEDADKSYESALAAGATPVMPPSDQPYGRSCGVNDTFGNTWWITSV